MTKSRNPDWFLMAIESGNVEDAKREIANDRTLLECRDSFDSTPLRTAIEYGKPELALELIELGANVSATYDDGDTCLHLAAGNTSDEWLTVVKQLLRAGADVNCKGLDEMTPLHSAAMWDSTEMVKLLLDAGASIDEPDLDERTPLNVAAFHGCADAVQCLLEAGADPTIKDGCSDTPEKAALTRGHHEVVAVLQRFRRSSG